MKEYARGCKFLLPMAAQVVIASKDVAAGLWVAPTLCVGNRLQGDAKDRAATARACAGGATKTMIAGHDFAILK